MPIPSQKVSLFPRSWTVRFKKRLQELPGVLLVALACLLVWELFQPSSLFCGQNAKAGSVATWEVPILWLTRLLHEFLGMAVWSLPPLWGLVGLRIIRHRVSWKAWTTLLSLVLAPLCLSTFLQGMDMSQVVDPPQIKFVPLGGRAGHSILRGITSFLKSCRLTPFLGPVLFLFLCAFFGLVKLQIDRSWKEIGQRLGGFLVRAHQLLLKITIRLMPKSTAHSRDEAPGNEDSVSASLAAKNPYLAPRKGRRRTAPLPTQGVLPLDPPEKGTEKDGYRFPPVDLLTPVKEGAADSVLSTDRLAALSKQLLDVLQEFGVDGEIVNAQPGPIVTMFEFRPAPGIKTSRVMSLADDIARSMSALSARISNIPGKNAIGIEIPNEKRQTVYLRPLLNCALYKQTNLNLPLILGKDIFGHPVLADLAKMPHLLVAGTTGSGKSVSINTMILSLLYKFSPETCRFIMVDPKMLELSVYNDIPHLLTPVVTDPKKAVFALKWAVREMESRYKAMSRLGVRNIDGFNQKILEQQKKGAAFTQSIQTGFDASTGKPLFEDQVVDYQPLPYIVVVVDEMADLMLVAGKEIELAVQRLAQMARAAGIHLIMATQRPSVDVITGTIKANFPTRISFQVTSKIDSRTILGEQGAEHLLGHGDMLYMSGGGRIQRVHGPFASDNDVEAVASFLKEQGKPAYVDGVTDEDNETLLEDSAKGDVDDLFTQAVELIRRDGRVSISYIQRNFQIGYNKAAKLVEQMEKQGIVSPPDRTGKRELLE